MNEFAFKMAFFNQPSRVDFDAVVATANRNAFGFGGFGIGFGEIDVLKEGAGAGNRGRVGEFVGADSGDDCANTGGGGVGEVMFFEVSFNGVVEGALHLTGVEF